MKPEDEKTETEKLEEEIATLQTKIKNTEYDLNHMFKGNEIIEQKLHNTKKLLEEKQERLIKLNPEQKDKLKKFEAKILEKKDAPISKNQEKMIHEMIEEEFL